MKKATTLIIALFMIFYSCFSSFAASGEYSFYVKRNSEHKTPIIDKEFEFISDYGGYYADKRAGDDKVVYLTFDAGYENGNVEKILDVLDARGVTGAFFVLENLIKRAPELVKRMNDKGHLVCNHTATHKNMTKIHDIKSFSDELKRLEYAYAELTGCDMAKIYRPPEGRFSRENLEFANKLGYKTVFWSFAYADWDNNSQPSPEAALEKILANLHNGEIMLLHPTSATNAAIMDKLIVTLTDMGYRFGNLEELWA
ncbi:MAG: polysaccharide deacetylase family protein, partial [Clostridia bacterium]|nr:polysaccharide deacetylase family protein [Clostridia bacterium]